MRYVLQLGDLRQIVRMLLVAAHVLERDIEVIAASMGPGVEPRASGKVDRILSQILLLLQQVILTKSLALLSIKSHRRSQMSVPDLPLLLIAAVPP